MSNGFGIVNEKVLEMYKNHTQHISLKYTSITDEEKEIATVLINDGWYGTFDELIQCVKLLNNTGDNNEYK